MAPASPSVGVSRERLGAGGFLRSADAFPERSKIGADARGVHPIITVPLAAVDHQPFSALWRFDQG
jgi:hypothetical protein